jgi:hypothetical protein
MANAVGNEEMSVCPIIIAQKCWNREPCKGFVKKSANMTAVGQCWMVMLPLLILSLIENNGYHQCDGIFALLMISYFSSWIALLLSWFSRCKTTGYPCSARKPKAPKIKYQQKEGINLCVPNVLASFLHVLGFTREAEIIHKYGMTEMLHSPLMNALDMTFWKAKEVLPNWLQISKYSYNKKQRHGGNLICGNERTICWEIWLHQIVIGCMRLQYMAVTSKMPMKQ